MMPVVNTESVLNTRCFMLVHGLIQELMKNFYELEVVISLL